MKNLVIFGATGSIGTSTIEIVKNYPEKFKLLGITCRSSINQLKKIAEEFRVPYLVVEKKEDALELEKRLSYSGKVLWGDEGLKELATLKEVDIVVVGISGIKGLIPA